MICPDCGANPAYAIECHHYRESGLENVWVENVGVFRCTCGQEYIQLPGLLHVQDKIAEQLLRKNSLLTGKEFKFLRKWLGFTSEELAHPLGVDRGSISRWENEAVSITADRLIRLFAAETKKVSLGSQSFFGTIASEPAENFSIVISDLRLASEIPIASEQTTTAIPAEIKPSFFSVAYSHNNLSAEPLTTVAANQELAMAA